MTTTHDERRTAGPDRSPAPTTREKAVRAIRLHRRSGLALLLVSLVGLVAFGWPFLAQPGAVLAQPDGGWLFVLLLPLLLVVILAEMADGLMDARSVALLGVLSAVAAVLRPLSGGVTGFQPMFVVVVLAGRVFGPGFGFTLGATSMLASALVTGGVGPWLPFQMLAAAWMGLLAGLLPRSRGKKEVGMLALYAGVSSLVYGVLLNLWFWPFLGGSSTDLSFLPGDAVADNASRLLTYTLATSLGFDVPRAIGNAVLVLLLGAVLLRSLRRVARQASFGATATFSATPDAAASTAEH